MDKNEAKRIFGENLKRLRVACGMSQDELAKALGYTNRSSINKIELGKNDMPRNKIARAAQVLGVSPLEFFREQTETLPSGSFRGGVDITAQNDKISPVLEKLSPNNQEKLLDYALFLLQQQDKGDES